MMTFRRFTILFFMILLGLNLWMILSGKNGEGLIREYAGLIYPTVVALYLLISVVMAFLPCAGFHHRVICQGEPHARQIALTFDDGPDPQHTPGILALLDKYDVKAAFFCTGRKCDENPRLLEQIAGSGHLVGNHSYTHSTLFDLFSSRRIFLELEQTNQVIRRITGKTPRFFRPPYGVVNPMVSRALKRSGMLAIAWSIRSMDTWNTNPERIHRRIIRKLTPGAVILLHDRTSFTAGHLDELIDVILKSGFAIVPLDVLLKTDAYAS